MSDVRQRLEELGDEDERVERRQARRFGDYPPAHGYTPAPSDECYVLDDNEVGEDQPSGMVEFDEDRRGGS